MAKDEGLGWADYFLAICIIGAAFLAGTVIEVDETQASDNTANNSFAAAESEITHFCIEKGFDDGYHSDYFNHINCYKHHSTEKFQQWKQEVGQ